LQYTKTENSIFNNSYPIENGIVNALPENLNYITESEDKTKSFFEIHKQVMPKYEGKDLLKDKNAMAGIQKEFYDKMANAFQEMDNADKASGGVFWWRVMRVQNYDQRFFNKGKLLFVGAGNCRNAMMYAQKGFDVTATDISRNMLKVGKKIADNMGIRMTFVAHNAEEPYPFKDNVFNTSYSLCVANHVTDWKNYFSEKMRCLKEGGVLQERMPNAKLWSFWKNMEILYEGMEKKAKYCNVDTARKILDELNLKGKVWTHDRIINIDVFYNLPKIRRRVTKASKIVYDLRAKLEDKKFSPDSEMIDDDQKGIYTVINTKK